MAGVRYVSTMDAGGSDVTRILTAVAAGDLDSREVLLTLVYDELRRLAAGKMLRERSGHVLQPTALVHEAYVRMFGSATPEFDSRQHFFQAASVAMERILIENARRDQTQRRGGSHKRTTIDLDLPGDVPPSPDVIALGEALERLEEESPRAALVVRLRYYIGLSIEEASQVLGVSTATVRADWTTSKAWLRVFLSKESE